MKKWSVLLALIIAVLCLTGCGKDDSKSDNSSDQKSTSEAAQSKSDSDSAGQTAEPVSNPAEDKGPSNPELIGKTFIFGYYEQDNNPDNGPEPIEWIVLDTKGNKALLMSKYILDAQCYYAKDEHYDEEYGVLIDTPWEISTMRAWLNGEFLNTAFSESEKNMILLTEVDNSAAQGRAGRFISTGNNTEDYIYLLSVHEVEEVYFHSDDERLRGMTDYAMAKGVEYNHKRDEFVNGHRLGCWWLRTNHFENDASAAAVNTGGFIYSSIVCDDMAGACPVLWVSMDALISLF